MERILLVDDEPDIANSVKKGLEMNGYSVDVFNDLLKALAEFKPRAYGLVISDIKMPNMNGFEMVNELQKMDTGVQVIFLTGFVDMYEEVSKLFGKLQVREVLKKPIGIKELLSKINAVQASLGRRDVEDVPAKQQEPKPIGEPKRELAQLILSSARAKSTLGHISQELRPKLDFTWTEFIEAVNYLVARGLLISRGNGFDLLFSTTAAGEREIETLAMRTPLRHVDSRRLKARVSPGPGSSRTPRRSLRRSRWPSSGSGRGTHGFRLRHSPRSLTLPS